MNMGFFNFNHYPFKRGIHPPEHKNETKVLPIRQFLFASLIILPTLLYYAQKQTC